MPDRLVVVASGRAAGVWRGRGTRAGVFRPAMGQRKARAIAGPGLGRCGGGGWGYPAIIVARRSKKATATRSEAA